MAEKKPITELSDEDLRKRINTFRVILGVMGLVALAYVVYYSYMFAVGRFDSERHLIGVIPMFAMLIAGIPSMNMLNKHKAELLRRRRS